MRMSTKIILTKPLKDTSKIIRTNSWFLSVIRVKKKG